jgi:hypothetical protein
MKNLSEESKDLFDRKLLAGYLQSLGILREISNNLDIVHFNAKGSLVPG